MLTHWNRLLNTDCKVYELGENFVYPIMRNGSSSLRSVVGHKYTNKEIQKCKDIVVFLRDPADRFVSGLNEYCRQNNADLTQTWQLVKQGKFIDRHFSPQWIWLLHLSRFYQGKVSLKLVKDLVTYCKVHLHVSRNNDTDVKLLDDFVQADQELMKYIGQTIDLEILVRKCKNVLS